MIIMVTGVGFFSRRVNGRFIYIYIWLPSVQKESKRRRKEGRRLGPTTRKGLGENQQLVTNEPVQFET